MFHSTLSKMFLLIVLISTLLYPIDSLKIDSPSPIIEPQLPADNSIQSNSKTNEQPVVIEGRFIIPEGNSDHLFRPEDFIKEETIQLNEGDTKDTIRYQYDTINPLLPPIQIIEGHFISYENDSDEHLFAKEDFEKHDIISN